MKAQTVRIKEFKILENFEAELNGNHVLVMGDNGVGKSSLIQFIQIALGLQKNIPANATGEGEVTFMKDGKPVVFSLKFKEGKPYIDVKGNGISISNKKGAIAELVGALDFDIDEFVELSKSTAGQKKQVEIFKSFLPSEIKLELAKHEANVTNAFNDRAEINKDIKRLEGAIQLHPMINHVHELDKFQSVNIDSVYGELKSVQEKNQKLIEFKGKVDQVKKDIAANEKEIGELKAKIEALEATNDLLREKEKQGDEYLIKNQIQDISSFEETIKTASEANQKHSQAQALKSEMAKLEKFKESAGELTAQIESSREAIANAIREMDGPIQDLTFDNDILVYKGVPVNPDNLSTSEIMELGIRLKMAENPELGMLFIQRGESLGKERLNLIKDIADKAGWQIIMEQVERGTKELHIEILAD